MVGAPGPAGPPGPAGESLGFDAAALAAIMGQGSGNNKGPSDSMNDDPLGLFGENGITQEERRALVLKAYEQLKIQFERFKNPDGQKQSPAKTCRDLAVSHPELPSGQYWIDPNEGDVRDAILVFCDMDRHASCVMPQPQKTGHIMYEGDEPVVWLGEVDGGMKVKISTTCNASCL